MPDHSLTKIFLNPDLWEDGMTNDWLDHLGWDNYNLQNLVQAAPVKRRTRGQHRFLRTSRGTADKRWLYGKRMRFVDDPRIGSNPRKRIHGALRFVKPSYYGKR